MSSLKFNTRSKIRIVPFLVLWPLDNSIEIYSNSTPIGTIKNYILKHLI